MRNAVDLLWKSSSVRSRFENTGILTQGRCDRSRGRRPAGARQRHRLAIAAAISRHRSTAIVSPVIAVGESGDVFARALQRWQEIENSSAFLAQVLDRSGQRATPITADGSACAGYASCSRSSKAGAARSCISAVTDGAGRFSHYKIVDPSFRNWFGLAIAMRDQAILGFSALQQELQPVLLRPRSVGKPADTYVQDAVGPRPAGLPHGPLSGAGPQSAARCFAVAR